MFVRNLFAPLLAVSFLVGCAVPTSSERDDDVATMQSEDALSAFGKLLVGNWKADTTYPRFTLAKDGTYSWDSGIRCVKAPCPSGDVGRFHLYVGAWTGTRYVNLRSNDGAHSRWLRVDSLARLSGAFGTTGSYTRDTGKVVPVDPGCTSYTDCAGGEQCLAGVCTARPVCVQIPVSEGRYLAKNFAAGQWAEANAWAEATAAGSGHSLSLATCAEVATGMVCTADYAPLCSFISGADGAQNLGNLCELRRAVIAAAGEYGDSQGFYTTGECVKDGPSCSTYWLKSDPAATEGAYYVHTFGSHFEAKSWIALQPGAVEGEILPGVCSELTTCTKEYAPVCGGVRSDEASTFGNRCMFMAAVRASSATDGWSKGYVSAAGACK